MSATDRGGLEASPALDIGWLEDRMSRLAWRPRDRVERVGRIEVLYSSVGPKRIVVLYRAADCHLQGDDEGFGFADPPSGSIGCSATPNNIPAGRVEQWVPITGGNNFLEAYFTDMWLAIGSKAPLPNQCARCGEKIDNAAGISWSFSVPAGGSVTKAHYTTLSPASAGGPPNNPIAGPGGRGGTTRNFGGTSLTLTGPKGCVKPPAKARFRVTSKRKKGISADRFGFVRRVKILRVDFFVEKVHKAKDLKAAFKAFLSTAGLAPASQHSVSANVLLQPLREHGRQVRTGKKFHTILRAPLTICP